MSDQGITITKICAENVLKFERFDLEQPGKLTLFRGANNQGKTTVLRLLSLGMKGADNPATVIHDGAKKGAVTLGLSNGYTLRRSFTDKGQYLDLLDDRGHKVPSPQKYLNEWLGEYRDFNPLAWLQMDPKEQLRILLQAVDVRLTPEEFERITGVEAPFDVDFEQHGLLVLEQLRSRIAEDRRIENRTADQKAKAATEARVKLPAERPEITDERRAAVAATEATVRNTIAQLEARQLAATNHSASVDRIERAKQREREEYQRISRKIADLRTEILRLEEQQREVRGRVEHLDAEAQTLEKSAPPTPEEMTAAHGALLAVENDKRAIADDEKTLARFTEVERLEDDAANAAAQSSILDETIKRIDGELRGSLMAKVALPVPSLTIDEGRILVGGHDLGNLAESQRMRIAVAIARALRPTLRVIVLDGAEQLDASTFALFLEEIKGDGFSYLATEVDRNGGPLEVVIFGEDGLVIPQQEVA